MVLFATSQFEVKKNAIRSISRQILKKQWQIYTMRITVTLHRHANKICPCININRMVLKELGYWIMHDFQKTESEPFQECIDEIPFILEIEEKYIFESCTLSRSTIG